MKKIKKDSLKEIKKSLAYNKRDKKKAAKIADDIVACMKPVNCNRYDYMKHMILPKELGKKLVPLFEYNKKMTSVSELKSPLIEGMVDGFVEAYIAPAFNKYVNILWRKQDKKEDWYGDMDYYFTKYLDNDKVRVSIISDIVTCSDDNMFIIIEDKKRKLAHVRIIVKQQKSDYPRNQYPHKLGLRFYKDRDFNMEYVKELHMTNKGGVYGDSRDEGYVLTYPIGDTWHGKIEHCLHYYAKISHVCSLLSCMTLQVNKGE